jgi:proteasome assembly chaperone (PAC2) family protein
MDGFTVAEVSALRSPIVILAFTGWSDTGTVTTDTAKRLIDAYDAQRFLTVDPEDYYVFTETRPTVRLDASGMRMVNWPANEAYFARLPDAAHDIVIVSGEEPNLRWRTFSERLSEAIVKLQPSLVCTLIARPAATPHTRPIPIGGSSADPALAAK